MTAPFPLLLEVIVRTPAAPALVGRQCELEVGHGESSPVKTRLIFDELRTHPLRVRPWTQSRQVIQIAGEPVHAPHHHHGVPVTSEPQPFHRFGSGGVPHRRCVHGRSKSRSWSSGKWGSRSRFRSSSRHLERSLSHRRLGHPFGVLLLEDGPNCALTSQVSTFRTPPPGTRAHFLVWNVWKSSCSADMSIKARHPLGRCTPSTTTGFAAAFRSAECAA